MKKLILGLILVVFGVSGVTPSSFAEILETKHNREWASCIVKDKGFVISRMITRSADKESFLVLDFTPGNCGIATPIIFIPHEKAKKNADKKLLHGSLRVDKKEILDISYIATSDEGIIYFTIEGVYGERIFRDALGGREVRLKIDTPDGEKIYSKYSLMGFTAAYERAQNLCKIMKGVQRESDEKYFPENEEEKFFKKESEDNEGKGVKPSLQNDVERL